ncbi:MAG TPA: class I SAM-dependent methyltransferase [Chloroflexia bacterium]|nr:class I SAM-dependent methyltransferase [Chloroflexia bacterium]
MSLQQHQQDWEAMAALDPLWAILSRPAQRYGHWALDSFLATGEAEIAEVLRIGRGLGYPQAWGRALDFGCGVGRVTRALAPRFQECVGVDISAQMIQLARQLNADRPNCTFVLNTAADLAAFPDRSFDLVYCNLVLMHLPSPALAGHYIGEFLRLIREGGLVVFELPYFIPWRRRLEVRRRLYQLLRRLGIREQVLYNRAGLAPIRMITVPAAEVQRQVAAHGGQIADRQPDNQLPSGVRSCFYYVHRP